MSADDERPPEDDCGPYVWRCACGDFAILTEHRIEDVTVILERHTAERCER